MGKGKKAKSQPVAQAQAPPAYWYTQNVCLTKEQNKISQETVRRQLAAAPGPELNNKGKLTQNRDIHIDTKMKIKTQPINLYSPDGRIARLLRIVNTPSWQMELVMPSTRNQNNAQDLFGLSLIREKRSKELSAITEKAQSQPLDIFIVRRRLHGEGLLY
ncbi:Guanine-specific ribonuclease N1/T1 [Penicillium malachiteum]|uniref:Guanine-specific ribonuclease N1/T1 n=1 Tax=Penicillium malachiteum TaxID=1324776 RepID=A0AAD6HEN0_9EURO|nr:Guanine-specific ribonuclease N1/T1 [Penicillium malachiteum]